MNTLSILIPVYHFDIRPLVRKLHEQCIKAKINFEIICLDDASTLEFQDKNRAVGEMPHVIYKELKTNVGRARIRNELAKMARFDFLLFMDCDSGVQQKDYIQNYIKQLDTAKLLYGGRNYLPQAPADPEYHLHWFYGTNREQTSAETRRAKPHHSFMTNNFLIPKALFQEIGFDERLVQYGHEDTLFGLELKKREIPIVHLDNPLTHLGLESSEIFLDKTKKAIENLFFLAQQNPLMETKLLSTYRRLKKWRLTALINSLAPLITPFLKRNLQSRRPSLFAFDVYKLLLFINCEKQG